MGVKSGRFRRGVSAIRGGSLETAMTPDTFQRLVQLAGQLVENLMTVAICAEEIRSVIRTEHDRLGAMGRTGGRDGHPASEATRRPIVDRSTLSLSWDGRSCTLGYTVLFRLADRLSRRPNQYLTADQLLRDVWEGGCRSPDTIRSAVRNLRKRLIEAGMPELAAAIRGRAGHYGLILDNGL